MSVERYPLFKLPESLNIMTLRPFRRVTIHIAWNLGAPAIPAIQYHDDSNFLIQMPEHPENLANFDLSSMAESHMLAHELGHAVGRIYNLPGSRGDIRSGIYSGAESYGKGMYQSEVEAWDIAEKMHTSWLKHSREAALRSYQHFLTFEGTAVPPGVFPGIR